MGKVKGATFHYFQRLGKIRHKAWANGGTACQLCLADIWVSKTRVAPDPLWVSGWKTRARGSKLASTALKNFAYHGVNILNNQLRTQVESMYQEIKKRRRQNICSRVPGTAQHQSTSTL